MDDFETFNAGDIPNFKNSSTSVSDENVVPKFNIEDFMRNAKILTKFINKSNNPDPAYAHEGDSGFDFRAFIDDPIVILPGKRKLIPTGLFFEIPEGYEIQVRPRSGLANKHGVLTSFGTVDVAYRGEILINLFNFGDDPFTVNNGDRIAQGVLIPRLSTEYGILERVEQLSETKRGTDGFGSTGVK
jgi:dUTP pyrophosphatase